eukprot:TRINITY_DN55930_c0_g1_i1.p1 TRINITY_DN55930_c0_g1~~TRINITY_DN55930_c0_g1_i1.p1  ORF type:complete len:900 (+),score=210.03 TRINITY_DN55930_c0_g1_i1:254-2953(+)
MAGEDISALGSSKSSEALTPGWRFGPDDDQFVLDEELGSGTAARVHACRRLRTGERLAAKAINLNKLHLLGDVDEQLLKLQREVQILQDLRHPRIVNLNSVHRKSGWLLLVMELVRGGELFDQIVKNRSLNEVEARYVFRQLLDGVGYMHSKRVIHRDLKPENILVASTTEAEPPAPEGTKLHEVKIADFGLSKVIREGASIAKTFVGTPQYWAPEVLNVQARGGSYTQAADFWSLGALLYVMLCGRYPFDGKKMPLEEQIKTATFNVSVASWKNASEEAKDLIRRLLVVNPSERASLHECMRHPWVTEGGASPACSSPAGMRPASEQAGSDAGGAVPLVKQPSTNTGELSPRSKSAASVEEVNPGGTAEGRSKPRMETGLEPTGLSRTEQESIFCLNELLKLQVSIAGSLEMAMLAFRHSDVELSDAIRQTFQISREISAHAANVVSRYAQMAEQVSQQVLPDLDLAVREEEPSLAICLLGMVKDWVASMQSDGEDIQRRYKLLQDSVNNLIRKASHSKMASDRRLQEAVQTAALEAGSKSSHPGPPGGGAAAQPMLALECGRSEHRQAATSSFDSTLSTPSVPPVALVPASEEDVLQATDSSVPEEVQREPPSTVSVPVSTAGMSMNLWTRQLFETLSKGTAAASAFKSGRGDGPMQLGDAKGSSDAPMQLGDAKGGGVDASRAGGASSIEIDSEAWKRDVLELLFMAPGMSHTFLETPSAALSGRCLGHGSVEEGGEEEEGGAVGSGALVSYVSPTSAAEAMAQSSKALLRALRELKRVDEILQGCSSFWANMDGTVRKLAQMKEHTECLVKFATSSRSLKERFQQRLDEYTTFWASLERICRRYVVDHQAATKQMNDMIREVSDATDFMDTAASFRMGLPLIEKRRTGYPADAAT